MNIKLLIFTFFIISLISCEKKKSFIIPDENYQTVLKEDYEKIQNITHLLMVRRTDYFGVINNWGFYDGEICFKYSWNKEKHLLNGNDLEIIFVRDRIGEMTLMKPENCIIGAKLFNEQIKAFFILWQNKGFNPIKGSKIKFWSNGYAEYYNEELDTTFRIFSPIRASYNWNISEQTDSLISNLDLKIIKKLYPKFQGKYKQVIVDTIFLDYKYKVETYEFYNSIKFNNFKLGYIRNYYNMIRFVNENVSTSKDEVKN